MPLLYDKIGGELEDYEIYYIKNDILDSMCMHPKYFQFLIPDRTIHVILSEELGQIPSEDVIIMMEPEDKDTVEYFEKNQKIELIDETWLLKVYIIEESKE